MRTHLIALLAFSISLVMPQTILSQQSDPGAGVPSFSTLVGGAYDRVNLTNGNILVTIPVRNKIGKIPFAFSLVGNSHAFPSLDGTALYWYTSDDGTIPQQGFWFQGVHLGAGNLLTLGTAWLWQTQGDITCGGDNYDQEYSMFVVIDSLGTVHPVDPQVKIDHDGCDTHLSGVTTDGSGYTIVLTLSGGLPSAVVYDHSGDKLSSSLTVVTDPDGVQESYTIGNQSGRVVYTYTDTLV